MTSTLESGDCREIMMDMALRGDVFDAIVTDPPYHLTSVVKRFGSATAAPAGFGTDGAFARASRGFMGKEWDGGDIAFQVSTWRACWELLKPGAHMAVFGGTRTYYRMAVAIEDAGFDIRDTLAWMYGTGFPKSHDVSKGIDKTLGQTGTYGAPKSAAHAGWIERGRMRGDGSESEDGWQRPWMDDPSQVDQAARVYIPGSPQAAEWSGWGTALKPAFEPIILARKPLVGTVARNVLEHGTGALNIDACRIPLQDGDALHDGVKHDGHAIDTGATAGAWGFKAVDRAPGLGRWPANVLHDGSEEVESAFAAFGESKGAARIGRRTGRSVDGQPYGMGAPEAVAMGYSDSGTASRFFYSAKATARDRAGSKHPTVKPLALMRWLLTLVTPPGGRVLDPFAGSGTTLQAAHDCGFSAVGIEREAEYQQDILRRLRAIELESLA